MGKQTGSAWLLTIVWIAAFIGVAVITLTCERESTSFHGIAETREMMISSESPVEIQRINVVEGQSVVRGQLLVELISPEQTLRINHISHQLEQLRAQKGVNKDEIRSKIKQLKAEKAAKTSEINNQIRQLQNQYNFNKELASGLKSIKGIGDDRQSGVSNPITLKIDSLRQELALSLNPLNIQIELLEKSLNASETPIKIQVEQLEKELALLKTENSKLNIYAQISGIIGSVNFKPKENVSPFAPILTLHTKNPSFVKGYIHENVYSRISVGKQLTITSQADTRSTATGTVVGVGARIVEYPVRLRKNPELQMWGREVVIRIPENNHFILGEKVLISTDAEKISFASRLKNLVLPREIHAEPASKNAESSNCPAFPIIPLEENIEASALLWLEDIERYLVLSDDTPDNSPLLFLMDKYGKITKEVTIDGLKKINDMESLALADDGTLYIASSLSRNEKGKLPDSRKLLIAVKREKDDFSLVQKTDLYKLLKKNASRNKDKDWAQFILDGIEDRSLDIEAMFYDAASLYLGFKTPFQSGHSVILKIENPTAAFQDDEDINISLWKSVLLKKDDESPQECISDMFYDNGILYLSGTSSSGDGGSLWQLDTDTGEIIRIASFDGLKPEGIAADPEKYTLRICFDEGSKKPSKIARITVAL
jgi:multidrug resistance efflux pump